jgi:hypothetical protein
VQINRPQTEQDSVDLCILALAETFDRKPTDALLNAYQLGLQDIPVTAIEQATTRAINTLTFMPKPVEIRRLCGEMAPEDRAVAAWQAVCDAIASGHNSYHHVDFDDGLINATIRNLGGWVALLSKTEEEFDKWAKQDFIKTYQAFMRVGVNGDACRPLVGLSDVGVHEVRYGDGTTKLIDLGGAKKVKTGLPPLALPHQRVGHRDNVPQLELKNPSADGK